MPVHSLNIGPWSAGKLFLTVSIMVLTASLATSQSVDTNPVDVDFEIINATNGQAGTIDKLVLQYSSIRLEPIFNINPSGSSFEVPAVPLKDRGKYILTAWKEGVPYYWSLRGRKFTEAPVILHVFDTASGVDDVAIVGVDLLVRKTQSLLELEYLIQVENSVSPQVSLVGSPHVMLEMPSGAQKATLSYGNGPNPEELEISSFSGNQVALAVPLTSGRNPMRLKTTLTWSEGMTIPMSSNVPITKWTLIATPVNLDIQSFDLIPTDITGNSGHLRYQGPSLAAEESFSFRISTLKGTGEEEDLFTQSSDSEDNTAEKESNKEEDDDGGFPFVTLTPILVVIIIVLAARRRRQA